MIGVHRILAAATLLAGLALAADLYAGPRLAVALMVVVVVLLAVSVMLTQPREPRA